MRYPALHNTFKPNKVQGTLKKQTLWKQMDIIFGFRMKNRLRNILFHEEHDGLRNLQPFAHY